ncbi:MAG: hypothetical protein AAFR61_05005 [Bacteroidota bacterium]
MGQEKKQSGNSEPKAAKENGTRTDPMRQLEAIKDIIFGPEMEQMTQRIENLQGDLTDFSGKSGADLQSFKDKMKDSLESLQNDIQDKLSQLEAKTNQAIAKLESEKTDRKELGEILTKLGQILLTEKE